jgi:hypothetical protein
MRRAREPAWFARPGDPLRIRDGVLGAGGTRGGQQRALPHSDQAPCYRRDEPWDESGDESGDESWNESGDESGENVELAGAICKPELPR